MHNDEPPHDPRLTDAHDYGRRQDGGCLSTLLVLGVLVSLGVVGWLVWLGT